MHVEIFYIRDLLQLYNITVEQMQKTIYGTNVKLYNIPMERIEFFTINWKIKNRYTLIISTYDIIYIHISFGS